MNLCKKIVSIIGICFLILLAALSYYIHSTTDFITPTSLSGVFHQPAPENFPERNEAFISLSGFGASNGCSSVSDLKFTSAREGGSLTLTIKGFYRRRLGKEEFCTDAIQETGATIPFNPTITDEITLYLDGKENQYRVVSLEDRYLLEPVKTPNILISP